MMPSSLRSNARRGPAWADARKVRSWPMLT